MIETISTCVRRRLEIGLAVALLAGPTGAVSLTLYLATVDPGMSMRNGTLLVLAAIIGALFFAPAGALVLPSIHATWPERGVNALTAQLIGGSAAGFLSPALFLFPILFARNYRPGIVYEATEYALVFGIPEAIGGAVAAVAYYGMSYRRRPTPS